MADAGKIIALSKAAVGADVDELKSAINSKQDAPATAGTSGQVLGLDSNLDPVWKDVSIDPEDIAEAVDAWLDDHPEATTTVEDGSITKAKLHDDVAERIDEVDELYEIIDPQEKVVPSKNLNVTPYVSATKSGCTFTVNEDNTVSLSGDPEATVYYPNVSENKDKRWKLPKGQYTLSGGIDAWKAVTLFLYVDQTDSSAAKEYVCGGYDGRPVTFTTEQDYWATTRFIVDSRNGDLTGYTFKPQIEVGDIATAYQSPWDSKVVKTSTFTSIEEELEKIKEVLPFSRSGNLVQYKPVKGESVSKRIDFESVDGFSTITFTHCGENLVPIGTMLEGVTFSKNGISGQVKDGYVLATGTNTSDGWTELISASYHSRNYWLPAGHYALGCGGVGTMNQASVSVNVNNAFVKTEPWKMIQFYESIRGGHTVDIKDPIILCAGDKVPKEYKPFEGETVTVTLPETVYGGWIDIDNSVLHVTKTLSGGSLVPTEEETYDLDPIVLTEIDGINTLYSIDGVVSASGEREESAVINFEEPVRDCYLNNGYLQSKTDRINELAESNIKNGDLFFIITDCHAENNRLYSIPLIREIGRKCNVKNLFDLGDNSDGIYSKTHELVQGLNNSVTGQTHFVYGNHEYMLASENKLDFLYSFGKPEQVGNFARNYYYIDNPQMKMRYIILNGYIENNGSWGHGYEQTQLTWLQNTALNVESGWGIIVFTHNTFTINWETGLVTGYDGTNTQSMLNVLDAYSGNGEIIAVFSGHMHIDAVEHTTGGIPVILTTCDKSQPYMSNGHADFDSSVRIINTISETAFDVVSVDRTNREIHCVRIGCPALNLVDDVSDGYVEERVIPFKS